MSQKKKLSSADIDAEIKRLQEQKKLVKKIELKELRETTQQSEMLLGKKLISLCNKPIEKIDFIELLAYLIDKKEELANLPKNQLQITAKDNLTILKREINKKV